MPLNISGLQILLHLFNFAILAGGLYLLLYKPVKKFMDHRKAYFQEMADQAEDKLRQAESFNAQYKQKLDAAEEEIRAFRAKAEKAAQEAAQQQLDAARAQASKIYTDAQESARRERERILTGAQEELKELAVSATEKLLIESKGDPFDQFLKLAEGGKRDG